MDLIPSPRTATYAEQLSPLLLDGNMDKTNQLPKTILYCLNPRDNEMIASMIGNFRQVVFQENSIWLRVGFNDQKRRYATSTTTTYLN